MSRSLNKVMLIGNVGSQPETRTTAGGTKVASVSLATNREWTDKSGQKQEKTEWHSLAMWDKLADIVERYVSKGDRIYVEGRVEYRTVESDSGTKYYTDIVVREMVMLGGDGTNGGAANKPATGGSFATNTDSPFA